MGNPKRKTINKWIQKDAALSYKEDSSTIYCSKCDVHLHQLKKHCVESHLVSTSHSKSTSSDTFYIDLIIFLVSCNIPWKKINNPQFRIFFQKYICCSCTSKSLPDESLLRKKYLDIVYQQTIQDIRKNLIGKYIWITVDETLNRMGKSVTNLIVRELKKNSCCKSHLIGSKIFEKVDGDSMAEYIKKQLQYIWHNSYNEHVRNVLVLSTDSAAYMLKAGKILKATFPNLLHVTCLAHGLHRVCEHIRFQYKSVDALISNVKKIFLKSPHRVRIFKQICPSVPLPPKPIITRWGTWLNAAIYYAENLECITEVISNLNSKESAAIREAKRVLKHNNLRNDLLYIKESYGILCEAIIKLQTSCLSLLDSLLILDQVRSILNWCGSHTVQIKLEKVLDRIPDYDMIRKYADFIEKSDYSQNTDIEYYKYAPVTSTEVERSFSSYKWIYNENRTNLKGDNVEKIMTILFYYREDEESIFSTDLDYDSVILNEDIKKLK